ncbi:MAG: hypothetical protein PHH28_04140 [Desulfuromonadaceae bacterium]|nr:hypothetical protein [Desulfuromonadaceae bacterium]
MMQDLLEDLLTFVFVTHSWEINICSNSGLELEPDGRCLLCIKQLKLAV